MYTMYETIMNLPLFKGTSEAQISEFLERTNLEFISIRAGESIACEGHPCTDLKFILHGQASMTIPMHDGNLRLTYIIGANSVLCANRLFGMDTNYPADIVALEDTDLMQLPKWQYLRLLGTDNIFLVNYLNYLSFQTQYDSSLLRHYPAGSITEWITGIRNYNRSHGVSDSTVETTPEFLCTLFHTDQATLSTQLESLVKSGEITIRISVSGCLSINISR